MKKIWIILLIVLGIIGVAGGVAYFFFWDDFRLLFGGSPHGGTPAKGGGVDLVGDYSTSESPAKPKPAASAGTPQGSSPEEKSADTNAASNDMVAEDNVSVQATEPKTSAEQENQSSEGSLDLSSEDEESKQPEPPNKETQKSATTTPQKSEVVPTLSRKKEPDKAEPATAPVKSSPAPVAPAPKPAPPPRPTPTTRATAPTTAQPQKNPKPAPDAEPAAASSIGIQKKAQSLIQRKRYVEAEALLNQYLATNPTDGDAHFMMGFLQIQQNRKMRAIPYFQKAMQTSKDPQIRQMAEQYLKKLR